MKRFWMVLCLCVTACAPRHLPPPAPPPTPMTEGQSVEEPPAQPVPPPRDAAFLSEESPEVQAALQQYQKSGKAPIIDKKSAGFVQYPFGLSQPVVICQPLHVCDIELEAGEEVSGPPAAGDEERWIVQGMLSGPPQRRTPHILVKPKFDGISTNLTIGTNKRVYYVALVSKRLAYMRKVRFYYPDDALTQLRQQQQHDRQAAHADSVSPPMLTVDQLDDHYEMDGQTTWRPLWVANDGYRTYLKMPSTLPTTDAPALFVQTTGGSNVLQNYRIKGSFYVVDGVFERAVLTAGSGSERQTVTITRGGR